MIWNGRAPSVRMSVLHVRATLPDQGEAEPLQSSADLPRFEDGKLSHALTHLDGLRPDEFRLECGISVLKEHVHHLRQVAP